MSTDALGDRMKAYERQETEQRFIPLLPIYARIDGRGFSKFTKGFERPYDERFRALMRETTKWLVAQTNARVGYTQSDEISLCWLSDRYDNPVFFDGKKQKMLSQLSAMATQRFNRLLWSSDDPFLRQAAERDPTFDARAFQYPNRTECANAFLWRELDATKNALSMAAREFYSQKELMGKNGADLNELLFQKGVNFNDYPAEFKRGVYVQRRRFLRTLAPEQLAKIPENRRPVDGLVERNEIVALDLPPIGRIANRVEVLFEGADPIPLSSDPPSCQAQAMTPTALLDALCDPSTMRLMMGELTGAELAQAQAVVRALPDQIQARRRVLVPVEPTPALLFSIAMRWDHAIGMDGYHDTFEGPGAHARIKAELLERAERVHRALIQPQTPDRELEAALQQSMAESKSSDERLIVASAVTYGLSQARQRGLAIVPRELTEELTQAGLEALSSELREPQDRPHLVLDLKSLWEEVSGEGFYRAEHPAPPSTPTVKPR